MIGSSRVKTVVGGAVLMLSATLVVGSLLGQPVLLSYVETDSMEPTLAPGDGYVSIPAEVAGPVEEGDIIVFRAQKLHGGGLTTHRVVEVTDQGYVTKGDGNPFTDQDGTEPYVTDGQVVATAWQVDGNPVVIPNLGTGVEALNDGVGAVQTRVTGLTGIRAVQHTHWLTLLLFGVGVLSLVAGSLKDEEPGRSRDRDRSRTGVYDGRTVVVAVAAVVFLAAAGSMLVAGGTQEYGIVSAETNSEAANVIPTGETRDRSVTVRNRGVLPVYAVTEPTSPGVDIAPRHQRVGSRDAAAATLSITAPSETGYYVRSLSRYQYVAVLPRSVVLAAHSVHPWLAVLTVASALAGGTAGALRIALGTGSIRTRTSNASRTISRR
ncbi:S26 family signal peptidase [Natronoarchaeum rubrum]|uniref:S26 family signal peptidase n=1 Tax=Natronoarchaeum rubrum TaxID=755311 RepID=UPI002112783E|nr:S26 family signal peptidase [Natronoarchaeum rubrum]